MFNMTNPARQLQACRELLDNNNINYRQLTKSKLEIYTKSPVYDKVFFFIKPCKLQCTTWDDKFTKKIENEEELIETIKRLEKGI